MRASGRGHLDDKLSRTAAVSPQSGGARSVIEASGFPILDVEIGEAALIEVDTQSRSLQPMAG